MKTPIYTRKANKDYEQRNGYVQYNRRILPEWKDQLDELLEKLRNEAKQ